NSDVNVRINRSGCSPWSATLSQNLRLCIESEHDSTAGKGACFQKGSTIDFFVNFHCALLCLPPAVGGEVNCFADSDIGSASAYVSGHCIINVCIAWLRILGQQCRGRHQLAGLAITALRYIEIHPRFLQWMRPIWRKTFDRLHFLVSNSRYL